MVQVHPEILVFVVSLLLAGNGALLTFIAHMAIRMFNKVTAIETAMAVEKAVRMGSE